MQKRNLIIRTQKYWSPCRQWNHTNFLSCISLNHLSSVRTRGAYCTFPGRLGPSGRWHAPTRIELVLESLSPPPRQAHKLGCLCTVLCTCCDMCIPWGNGLQTNHSFNSNYKNNQNGKYCLNGANGIKNKRSHILKNCKNQYFRTHTYLRASRSMLRSL